MRGRTDFEDSLLSARREEQAKEKRRFQAMTEALKARGIPSDPDGSRFRAAREQAIASRRADNARLQTVVSHSPKGTADFAETRIEDWDETSAGPGTRQPRRLLLWAGMAAALSCLGLAAGVAYTELMGRLAG